MLAGEPRGIVTLAEGTRVVEIAERLVADGRGWRLSVDRTQVIQCGPEPSRCSMSQETTLKSNSLSTSIDRSGGIS